MNIVILDKSATVRSNIITLLDEIDQESFNINEFDNAEIALEYINETDVNLIFSSVETDGMDGLTFIDLILRNNPKIVSHLFIITSHRDKDILLDIKDVGAKRFIKKPIKREIFRHYVVPEIIKALYFKN